MLTSTLTAPDQVISQVIPSNEDFPNNPFLPVVVYKNIDVPANYTAQYFEKLFITNQWGNSWQSVIENRYHFHSITHEVLGIADGSCMIELGGKTGFTVSLSKGDVIFIPAGVGHKSITASSNLLVVGAYPLGASYDMKVSDPLDRKIVEQQISKVPLPDTDPVYGAKGILFNYWTHR